MMICALDGMAMPGGTQSVRYALPTREFQEEAKEEGEGATGNSTTPTSQEAGKSVAAKQLNFHEQGGGSEDSKPAYITRT